MSNTPPHPSTKAFMNESFDIKYNNYTMIIKHNIQIEANDFELTFIGYKKITGKQSDGNTCIW